MLFLKPFGLKKLPEINGIELGKKILIIIYRKKYAISNMIEEKELIYRKPQEKHQSSRLA
jgi:hypothetical protein